MTTIVDLDTGQVLGVVDGRDHKGVGDWLFARPLEWRLAVQVVAIDPSAAFRKALRMWLPRTAVAVDHFHLISLANQAMTETRQNLSQQVKGRRGRAIDKAWAHRMLLLRGSDTLSCRAALRLEGVFAVDDPTGTLQAVWKVKEQLRHLLRTNSLEDAAAAKEVLEELVKTAARPETNRLYRTVCRWWKGIEVLIITGATTGKVEANNTAITNIKRTARGYRNAHQLQIGYSLEKCRPDGGMTLTRGIHFPTNREEPAKRRFFCDEYLCSRQTFTEETSQVPRRARSTSRLRDALVAAVIGSGRAAAEAAAAFGVSWWLVQKALDSAALTLPDVDALAPRMLGIDEHRYRSVRFFRDPATKAWKRYEPWMTTIVDLDTGQVLGIVDGRDSDGVGDWLFARPLEWRLGVQVVAIDPSAAFRKALRMWLPRTAVSVDAFHLVKLGNDMLTEVRQRLTQQVHGRRGRSIDPVWANRRLLLRAGDTLSDRARARLSTVFATDDATGKLQAAWLVKEQLRALLTTGSLADAAVAKDRLQVLVERAAQPETNRLWRTVCRWWKEIEVLIVTGATTAKVEANNTAIKHIKRTGRGFTNAGNYKTRILLRSAARTAA